MANLVELPNNTKQVLLGSLLGDGGLNLYRKFGQANAYYREERSAKNKEYARWKANFLMPLEVKYTKKRKFFGYLGKHRMVIEIRSRSLPILTECHKIFYPEGRKVISPAVLEKLDGLGIATWYCDDGSYAYSYRTRGIHLCTHAFSHDENLLIKNWFSRRWGINPKIHQGGGGKYRLWFNQREATKLVKLIERFVPKSMRYKLGEDKKRLAAIPKKRREYHLRNREKLIERTIAWHKRHPDKIKKYRKNYNKNYRIKHRERLKQKDRDYYKNHQEKAKQYARDYYVKNRKRKKQYDRNYYAKHRKRKGGSSCQI